MTQTYTVESVGAEPRRRGKQSRPIADRLMDRVVWNGDEDECWEWQGCKNVTGYGLIALGASHPGKSVVVHRVSFEHFVGPIPRGLSLDHLCRNRACVNPAHLEPVTHRVNVLRGESPAAKFAARDCCPQGHPFDEENTYHWRGRRLCRACRRVESLARYHRKKK